MQMAERLPLCEPRPGTQIEPVSFKYASALHLAAYHGHLEVIDLLLLSGACDVRARNAQAGWQG